jgi:hypothetical protein
LAAILNDLTGKESDLLSPCHRIAICVRAYF